ncbi:MAG: hypothetical protein Q7T34_00560 [Candidatus Parcubacteria bacterium]|nr:hypothetical protein [Candidatus Parcubacteria bacterium]
MPDQKNDKKLDFLKREDIKTMSKDIAVLREKEAAKQRERVSRINPEEEIEKKKPVEIKKEAPEENKEQPVKSPEDATPVPPQSDEADLKSEEEKMRQKAAGEEEARKRIEALLQKQEEFNPDESAIKPEFPKRQTPPPIPILNEEVKELLEPEVPAVEPEIKTEQPIKSPEEVKTKPGPVQIDDTVAETDEDLIEIQPQTAPIPEVKEEKSLETKEKEAIERLKAETGKQGNKQNTFLPKIAVLKINIPKITLPLNKPIVRFLLFVFGIGIIFFISTFLYWYFVINP